MLKKNIKIHLIIIILFILNISKLYSIEQNEQSKYFELVWEKEIGEKIVAITSFNEKNNRLIYIVFENGTIQALNKDNAVEIWKFSTDQKIKFSPSLADEKIFFGTNEGTIYSLDSVTGNEKWKSKIKKPISTPLLFHQKELYFGSYDYSIYKFNADNGKLLWKFKTEGVISEAPQIFENIILISSLDGHIYALESSSGTELWEINTGFEGINFPFEVDKKNNLIFISSNENKIYAIDPKSGEIKWEFLSQKKILNKSMILIENLLSVSCSDGILYSIDAMNGKLKWSTKTGTFLPVNPPKYKETYFIATERGEIIAINVNDGNIVWRNKIAERIKKSPLQFENTIIFASDQGFLYGLDILSGNIMFKFAIDYYSNYFLYYDLYANKFYYFSENKKILAFEKTKEETKFENIEETISNREYIPPPVFSPDGKYYLFSEAKLLENDHNLYRVESAYSTSKIVKLTSSIYDDLSPQWFFDSNAILFSSNREGNYNIYKMDMTKLDIHYYNEIENNECTRSNTDSAEDLAKLNSQDIEKKYLTMLTEELGDKKNPIPSPLGNKILYSSKTNGNWDLWIMDSTGQNKIRLTSDAGDKENASFSPDGKKIVYVISNLNNKHICSIDIDGTVSNQVTYGQTDNINPKWLNDSTIVYEKINSDYKYSNLWIVSKEGINSRELTSGNFRDSHPSPSPDGKSIAFLSNRKNKKDNIWIINSLGKGMAQISNLKEEVHPVSWLKDSNKLVFFTKDKTGGNKKISFLENIDKVFVQEFFIQAENLISNDKYEDAEKIYESIISDYPDQKVMVFIEPAYFNLSSHTASLYKILKIAEYQKDFEKIAKFQQFIINDRNDYDDKKMFSIALLVRIQLLEEEFKNKNYNGVIEEYKKILNNSPEMNNEYGYPLLPYIFMRIAECYEKLQKYEQAIGVYKKNQEDNPSLRIMFDKDNIETMAINFLNIAKIYETEYQDYNNTLKNYLEIFKKYPDDKFVTIKGEVRGEYSQKAAAKLKEIYSSKEIDVNNWLDICSNFNETLKEGKTKKYFKHIITDLEKLKNGNSIDQQSDKSNKILFSSKKPGDIEENNYEIYSINEDGSELKRITYNKVNDYQPVWSKDGMKIAYHTIHQGNYEIFLMDYDGTNQTNLTNTPECYDFEPSWSCDGTRISFTSDRDGNMEIYVMNNDGSEQINITSNPARDFESNYSPINDKIVFTSNRDDNLEIYLNDLTTGKKINLTKNRADDHEASFSPDGNKILFTSNRDGNEEIYVMKLDGSQQQNLSNNPSYDYNPTWSSDGKHIIFVSNRDNLPKIFIMNVDGSHQIKLTDDLETYDIKPNALITAK